MKSALSNSRWLILAMLLGFTLRGQTTGSPKSPETEKGTVVPPGTQRVDEATLKRLGKASTVAEAAPLLKELEETKEAHFQARRVAKVRMKGKGNADMTKIWTEMQAAEKKRLERMAELEFKVSEIRRQEWEKQRTVEKSKALGRS